MLTDADFVVVVLLRRINPNLTLNDLILYVTRGINLPAPSGIEVIPIFEITRQQSVRSLCTDT